MVDVIGMCVCAFTYMCTEGDFGGLRQDVMTPHKLHISTALLHFLSTITIMYWLR